MPSFNEVEEVPDDGDPIDHPLRLHRLSVNRREDSPDGASLPARNQVTVRHRLHRAVVEPPLLEAAVEGMNEDLLEEDSVEDVLMEDVI